MIEAELVGDHVLVEIAIVEIGAVFGSKCLLGRLTRIELSSSSGGRCG